MDKRKKPVKKPKKQHVKGGYRYAVVKDPPERKPRTGTAIIQRVTKPFGYEREDGCKNKLELICHLISQGKNVKEIEKETKIERTTIWRYMQDPEFKNEILKMKSVLAYGYGLPALINNVTGKVYKDVEVTEKRIDKGLRKGEFTIKKTTITRVNSDQRAVQYLLNNFDSENFADRSEVKTESQNLSAVFLMPSIDGKMQIPEHIQMPDTITMADIEKLKKQNPNVVIPEELLSQAKKNGSNGNGKK
jgi:hypothetical protein